MKMCKYPQQTHRTRVYMYVIHTCITFDTCAIETRVCMCVIHTCITFDKWVNMMLQNTNQVLLQCLSKLSSIYPDIAQRRYKTPSMGRYPSASWEIMSATRLNVSTRSGSTSEKECFSDHLQIKLKRKLAKQQHSNKEEASKQKPSQHFLQSKPFTYIWEDKSTCITHLIKAIRQCFLHGEVLKVEATS